MEPEALEQVIQSLVVGQQSLDARFTAFAKTTEARFDGIDRALKGASRNFEVVFERLDQLEVGQHGHDGRMDALENRMDALENRMDALEKRMDALEKRMDALEAGQKRLEAGQAAILERLDHLIELFVRERTATAERFDQHEARLERLEQHAFGPPEPPKT